MYKPTFIPDAAHIHSSHTFIPNLIHKYSKDITGVIHIGGHLGQEYDMYIKNDIKSIIFVEPQPDKFRQTKEWLHDKCLLFNTALGNTEGTIEMYVSANNGMSSSVLEPKVHLDLHPEVLFNGKISVPMTTLDNLPFNRAAYNFINIDVQGYELEVFKGGVKTLNTIKYIAAEVNREEVYKNCGLIDEVDAFLAKYEFKRQATWWHYSAWGEAFYIKSSAAIDNV